MAKSIRDVIDESMARRGITQRCTEEEYRAWVAENYAKAWKTVPTHDARIGLSEADLNRYHWGLVMNGISDGSRARDVVRTALNAGHGLAMLYGSYGQGKTLVLKIAVAEARRAGKRAAYANMGSILDDLMLSFDQADHRQTELLRKMQWWQSLDLLCIDELDKANATPWASSRMHQLLDERYTRAIREEALTVIAANLDRGVDSLDGYLASRLQDNRFASNLVEMNGPDARQVMPKGYRD